MPELRRDPILDRYVIIAEERGERPQEFVDRPDVRRRGECPFCEGAEAATPGEVFAIRAPGSEPNRPGWSVRVIPNKYPAATMELGRPVPVVWPIVSMPALGVHEVIIESAEHVASAGKLTERTTIDVLSVYRARLRALRASTNLRYVQIFRNVGEPAGASIEHLHSQLLGLTVVPPLIADEVASSQRLFAQLGRCPTCEVLKNEVAAAERVVEATDDLLLYCPYASRFPYEMCLAPRRHAADFETAGDTELVAVGGLLRRGLARLESLLENAPGGPASYNCVLHTAPFDSFGAPHYHWHIEILPRIVKAAGFEWGTGVHINPVAPETAAARLRGVSIAG